MCSEQYKIYFLKENMKKSSKKFGGFKYYPYFCSQKTKK